MQAQPRDLRIGVAGGEGNPLGRKCARLTGVPQGAPMVRNARALHREHAVGAQAQAICRIGGHGESAAHSLDKPGHAPKCRPVGRGAPLRPAGQQALAHRRRRAAPSPCPAQVSET